MCLDMNKKENKKKKKRLIMEDYSTKDNFEGVKKWNPYINKDENEKMTEGKIEIMNDNENTKRTKIQKSMS